MDLLSWTLSSHGTGASLSLQSNPNLQKSKSLLRLMETLPCCKGVKVHVSYHSTEALFLPPALIPYPSALWRLLNCVQASSLSGDCLAPLSLSVAGLAARAPRRRWGLTRPARNILVSGCNLCSYAPTDWFKEKKANKKKMIGCCWGTMKTKHPSSPQSWLLITAVPIKC